MGWHGVYCPIVNGSLGLQNLSNFNKALLGKWLWRYQMEGDSLWREFIDRKYGGDWGEWCSKEGR